MSTLFAFLFLFSIIGLVIGLIKPSLIKMKSRKQAILVSIASIIVFFILFNITAPDIVETKQVDNQNIKAEKKEEDERKIELKKEQDEKKAEEAEKRKKEEAEKEKKEKAEKRKKEEAEKRKKEEAEKEKKEETEKEKKEEAEKKKKEEAEKKKKEEVEKEKEESDTDAKDDITWDDVKSKDKIVGKSNKDFADISKSKPTKVRNDKTGNWRKSTIANNINTEEYALSYHKLHMEEGEVHFIINLNYNTTTWIIEMNELLFVDVREYVKGEELDAKNLGSGMVLISYVIYPDGDIEEIPLG